jgi:hypothetical protein
MASFSCGINVGENIYQTYLTAAATTDADIGKPVKLNATSEVALCDDGDQIFGFIASVEPQTVGGKKLVSVLTSGRVYVILSGNSAIGTLVEAHTNTDAGVAKAGNYGLVSTHTLVAGTYKQWRVIAGSGLDTATVLIEKQ